MVKKSTKNTDKVRWGILGTAKIAQEFIIPAIKKTKNGEVVAIASRSLDLAKKTAKKFNLKNYYGSYQELLQDKNIDAIYNPLPNHLHVPLSLEAGKNHKHVLCEKPVALNQREANQLKKTFNSNFQAKKELIFLEGFMVRFHQQWKEVLKIIKSKRLGKITAVQSFFSYSNQDVKNIRNIATIGGGSMYDIGCYATLISKLIFGQSPKRVISLIDRDPLFKTDRLTSAIYDFELGRHSTFTVSTQLVKYQRVNIIGTKARLEIQIPFNAPINKQTKIFLDDGKDLSGKKIKTITIPTCNQYLEQCHAFNQAVLGKINLDYGIEDAIDNMKIIDAVFKSAQTKKWEKLFK